MSRFSPDSEKWAEYRAHLRALKDAGPVWDSTRSYTPRAMSDAGIKMWVPVFRGRGSKRRVVAVIPYLCSWFPGRGLQPICKETPVMVQPLEVSA